MDMATIAAAIAICKRLPDTAANTATVKASEAAASAAAAAQSADSVDTATVVETTTYLGIA